MRVVHINIVMVGASSYLIVSKSHVLCLYPKPVICILFQMSLFPRVALVLHMRFVDNKMNVEVTTKSPNSLNYDQAIKYDINDEMNK